MQRNSRSANNDLRQNRTISRGTLITVLNAAIEMNELRFARQLALSWLAVYPGDLEINRGLARIFILEGKAGQAIQILEKICQIDPEDVLAQQQLLNIYDPAQGDLYQRVLTDLYVLGQNAAVEEQKPGWSTLLRKVRKALLEGKTDQAETLLYQVLAISKDNLLIGITHLEVIRKLKDHANYLKFAELYQNEWPDSVLFKLALAEAKIEAGDEAASVALLHQCVSQDAAGQVPTRWWGATHPYKPLWPEQLEVTLDIAIPPSIANSMGWNRLSSVSGMEYNVPESNFPVSEFMEEANAAANLSQEAQREADFENKVQRLQGEKTSLVKDTEAEFAAIAQRLNLPQAANTDGRFPIYVVFSSKAGLKAQYGEESYNVIDGELATLAEAVRTNPSWGSIVFYPDDFEKTGKLGMKTTAKIDPAKLKESIIALDGALSKKGGRIGAMLIVGGPRIIPFHSLPNPTNDSDDAVLSDNPYASLDSNYFVPEWPIGRMMGEENNDTGLLLQQIRAAISYHKSGKKDIPLPSASQFMQVIQALLSLFRAFKPPEQQFRPSGSFGLSASVWKKSSAVVYGKIGGEKALLVCPPTTSGTYDPELITGNDLAYFNLHGLPTTPEWYGQGSPEERENGPEYPIALKASDLEKGKAPRFVFTEACYGGYVVDKDENNSLALRFASIGTQSIIGSTCISYGSISTPLVGADLLAFYYWTALKQGYAAGDALMQAKLSLVREMNNRQGYLDGEDQKTLISFVLYGDPLVYLNADIESWKRVVRYHSYPQVKAISDHDIANPEKVEMQDKWVQYAKDAVASYVPNFDGSDVSVNQHEVVIEKQTGPGIFPGYGTRQSKQLKTNRTVVIFKKKIRIGSHVQTQYARVTLNQDGKLVKVAFSR